MGRTFRNVVAIAWLAALVLVPAAASGASMPARPATAAQLQAQADATGARLAGEDRQLADLDADRGWPVTDVLVLLVSNEFDADQRQLDDLRSRISLAGAAERAAASRAPAPAPTTFPAPAAAPAPSAAATPPAAVATPTSAGSSAQVVTAAQVDPAVRAIPVSEGAQAGGTAPTDPHARAMAAAWLATRFAGVRYRWAGASPEGGFDCSGLVVYVWGAVGVHLPRTTWDLWKLGHHVAVADLQEGDLVFFDNLGHVGIYVGSGMYVQAPHTGDVVKLSRLSTGSSYVGAVRLDDATG